MSSKKIKAEFPETSYNNKSQIKPLANNKQVVLKKIKDEPEISEDKLGKTEIKTEPSTSKKLKREHFEDTNDDRVSNKRIKLENVGFCWQDYELLAEIQNLTLPVARATVKLFEEGNTIPFIARYRKANTGNMDADQLRCVKEEYDKISALKQRSQTVLKSLEKGGHLNDHLRTSILSARSAEELEHIYAPYKQGSKGSLAERAKSLGLETVASNIIKGVKVNYATFVDVNQQGLKTEKEVEDGIIHIIASIIASDTDILSLIREINSKYNFFMETKKHRARATTKTTQVPLNKEDESKFESYFDFKISRLNIRPHQILAINRAESYKFISVKVIIPEHIFGKFSSFCKSKWKNYYHAALLENAFLDSYNRLVQPYLIRQIRSELKKRAEEASYEVFSTNLKQLLLMPPLKGRRILGIDPGFSNGCKISVISENGSVLATDVIFPSRKSLIAENILKNLLIKHNCNLIALGNGTACRETETWLTSLIEKNTFAPLEVSYTIVNECGASIYSCSSEAKKEFPNMDPNLISAVSLARRIQEPLAELVKVAPKHLGVGMYQHDLPKKQLEQALDEVVSECVSFVGVDLNTASHCLLQHVAGLSEKRAKHIIEYREKHGLFESRHELLKVIGIGQKVFQQCAGFLRVINNAGVNILDSTYIHPESYDITLKLLKKLNLKLDRVGREDFINALKDKMGVLDHERLCDELQTSNENLELIFDTLGKPLNFDLRSESLQTPIFKKGLTSMNDLSCGDILTGCVVNVTHFGCFIDVGVGKSGLVHQSKLNGNVLQIGDRVEVKVLNLDVERKRIGLGMIKKL